jgi:hypothetical protein
MWLRASLSTAISLSVICVLQSVNGAPLDETVKSISLPDVGQTKSPFDNLKGVSEEEADRFLLNRLSSSSNRHIGFDSASDEYYASPPSYRTGAYLRAGSKVIEHFNKGLDRQDWHPYARGFTEIEKLWNTHDYSDDEDEDWRRMLRAKRRRQFQKRLKKSGRKQADEGELESFF